MVVRRRTDTAAARTVGDCPGRSLMPAATRRRNYIDCHCQAAVTAIAVIPQILAITADPTTNTVATVTAISVITP